MSMNRKLTVSITVQPGQFLVPQFVLQTTHPLVPKNLLHWEHAPHLWCVSRPRLARQSCYHS